MQAIAARKWTVIFDRIELGVSCTGVKLKKMIFRFDPAPNNPELLMTRPDGIIFCYAFKESSVVPGRNVFTCETIF